MLVPLSVEEVMTADVETITLGATARDVARRLAGADVGSLVVVDNDKPIGIVTESDLTRLMADGADFDGTTVESFMSRDPTTVGPEASLERAAELLKKDGFRRLPVVESGDGGDQLVGIVTATDLSYYLPHLALRRRRAEVHREEGERLPSQRPEMAYEEPDWEFEHSGESEVNVGNVVRFRKQLSEGDVRAFAETTGDTNRLHLDEEFAAGTRFGRRIAHGVLTTGLISAALARLPGLTVYLAQDLRFLGPLPVGDVATAVCRVTDDLGGDRYQIETTVYDEAGERIIDGESVVLIDALPEGVKRPAEPLS